MMAAFCHVSTTSPFGLCPDMVVTSLASPERMAWTLGDVAIEKDCGPDEGQACLDVLQSKTTSGPAGF